MAYMDKRTGRKKWRVAIKPKESDIWIANFVFDGDPALDWIIGDTVVVNVEKNGDFWNWKHADVKPTIPKKTEILVSNEMVMAKLEEIRREINEKLDTLYNMSVEE